MTKHTFGSIKAAEIITQHDCDSDGSAPWMDQKRFNTRFGLKTVMGIAAIIEDQTGAAGMLEALETIVHSLNAEGLTLEEDGEYMTGEDLVGYSEAVTAIAKANGDQV